MKHTTNKKISSADESFWEKIERRSKICMYNVMHELLQSQVFSPFLYQLLIFIETLQLLYFSLFEDLPFLWPTDGLKVLRQAIQYFQIHAILINGEQQIFFVILYLVFAIQVIILGLLIYIITKIMNPAGKTSTFFTYSIKLVSTYGLFLNTFLTIPFFNILIATIYCQEDSQIHQNMSCYSGIYFLHLTCAIIGLIIMILLSLVYSMLYVDLNPNSVIPFAAPLSKINIIKLIQKIFVTTYITLDSKRKMTKEYIIILMIYELLILVQRHRTPSYYNLKVYTFQIICDTIIFWVTFCATVHAYLDFGDDIDDVGFVYMLLGIPIVSKLYYMQIQSRDSNSLKMNVKDMKKDTDVEMFVTRLIQLIESIDKPESKILIEGVLRLHSRQCTKGNTCQCYALNNLENNEEDVKIWIKQWYYFAQLNLEQGIEKFQKSARLHLLHAFIQHHNLHNRFKALFELMHSDECKPNLQEEFSIFRYSNLIEEEMIENDNRQTENKGVDVNQIIEFQNQFVQFLSSLEKNVNLYLEFWRELTEENPDIQKLQSLGSKITETLEQNATMFKKLQDINSNHIQCLQNYGYFLKDITNDEHESSKIIEKMEYAQKSASQNKQTVDNYRQKYGENSNACIINISGNKNNIGSVINCNNEIQRMLGFAKNDLLDQNIKGVMPKAYADYHDGILENFLKTSKEKIIGKERMFMGQNKQGYMVPCTAMVKVIPSLALGIQFVAFIKDIDVQTLYSETSKVHFMLYNTINQNVMGVTRSLYESLGIPASIIYGNSNNTTEFTIDQVAPEIDMGGQNYEEMKQASGLIVTFDTTYIQQNFLLDEEDSKQNSKADIDFEGDVSQNNLTTNNVTRNDVTNNGGVGAVNDSQISDENGVAIGKISKFRKIKVRVNLEMEDDFGADTNLRLIRVTEVDDNDASKMNRQTYNFTSTQHQNKGQTVAVEEDEEEDYDQNKDNGDNGLQGESMQENQDQINDDMRALKDFKALIGEKTVPKSIQILQKTVFILLIVISILAGVELQYKSMQNDEIRVGTSAINSSYQRHNIMVDINYQTRKIEMLSNDQIELYDDQVIGDSKYEDEKKKAGVQYQSTLEESVNTLQDIQFEVIESDIKMEERQDEKKDPKLYQIEFILQNGETKSYNHIFTDAIFSYITAAHSLSNSTLESFNKEFQEDYTGGSNDENFVESTKKNIFFVRENGLFVLRKGSEDIASEVFDFFVDQIQAFQNYFLIIMILGIIFLVLSQVLLIPIVFNVHKTNNRVLSLFGIIPSQEIRQLVQKCEIYMAENLDDHQDKKDENKNEENNNNKVNMSQINEEPGEDENLNQSQQPMMQTDVTGLDQTNNLTTNNDNTLLMAKGGQQTLVPPNAQSGIKNSSNITQQQQQSQQIQMSQQQQQKLTAEEIKKAELKKIEDQKQDEEADMERSEKLMNSKDSNKKIYVICQFSIFALFFIIYFVVNFILEQQFLNQIEIIYNHLQYVEIRPSILKYNVMFTLEEIVTGDIQKQGSIKDLREWFTDQVYDNEKKVLLSVEDDYPSQLDEYMKLLQVMNYEPLCENSSDINGEDEKEECKQTSKGILEKGLLTSIVALVEDTRDILSKYRNNIEDSTSDQEKEQIIFDTVNSDDYIAFDDMIKFMDPAMKQLNNLLLDNIEALLDSQSQIETIKFSIFIVVALILFFFIWTPYLSSLNNKIWSTKGMLNMIPIEIIMRHEKLKKQMSHGEILQAVK